jgi:hypothetical protein
LPVAQQRPFESPARRPASRTALIAPSVFALARDAVVVNRPTYVTSGAASISRSIAPRRFPSSCVSSSGRQKPKQRSSTRPSTTGPASWLRGSPSTA